VDVMVISSSGAAAGGLGSETTPELAVTELVSPAIKIAGQRHTPATASERIFFMRIFQFCPGKKISRGRFWVERPARGREILKIKNLQTSQTRNGGKFDEPPKTVGRTGLILLFAEKRFGTSEADEHNQTGILTSASNLTPAFPNVRSVALGVCSRYSGATVPESHRVPRHLTALQAETFPPVSKNTSFLRDNEFIPRQFFATRNTCIKTPAFAYCASNFI